MNVTFFHPIHFEKWEPDTPDVRGIGGSETSQIELAWRLARRGHSVVSYAPVPWTGPRMWRGVEWCPLEEADWTRDGLWLLYRCPQALDSFPDPHPAQQLYLVSQDESYDSWNEERLDKLDVFVALCDAHAASHAASYPGLRNKIRVASNGIKVDQIREIEREGIVRNPRKLLFASSPDRGLRTLLHIFKRAREWVDDLELAVAYGFENINTLEARNPSAWKYLAKERDGILRLAEQPGVKWLGRLPQPTLLREWFSAGIWCHPSLFTETSGITCMDAQACGAVPITTPIWAVGENVRHGSFISGDVYTDGLVQCRYVAEIVEWATHPERQDALRPAMMEYARHRFNWEREVDRLEAWMLGVDNGRRQIYAQNAFQLRHMRGRTLNIGCEQDTADLRGLGAVNLDVCTKHPTMGYDFAVDVVADARQPLDLAADFDTVICGDLLEHMDFDDAAAMLRNAAAVLREGGRIVITCPDDRRDRAAQNPYGKPQTDEYVAGVRGYHRPRPREELLAIVEAAGLAATFVQPIDYGFFEGWGVVAEPVTVRAETPDAVLS